MKGFYKDILRYFLVLAAISIVCYFFNQSLFRKIGPIIPQGKTIVSCGVSFSQFALDEQFIDNFHNASTKGKSGLGIYKSAQKIVEFNPHVKTLIVDGSIFGIPVYRDYKFFLKVFAPREFKTCYPISGFSDFSNYPINYKYYIKSQMRNEWIPNIRYIKNYLHLKYNIFDYEIPYIGKFSPQNGFHLEGSSKIFEKRLNLMQKLTSESAPMSTIDIHYTDSLVMFAANNDINLVFFCSPTHTTLNEILPEEYYIAFRKGLEKLDEQNHVKVYDFSELLMPDSCFFNVNHLNKYGSAIISKMLNDSLNNG